MTIQESSVATAAERSALRPFTINVPQAEIDDLVSASRPRSGPRRRPSRSIAGRAARNDSGAGAPLGDGLRLAQGARRS